jgi:hypothetical protein
MTITLNTNAAPLTQEEARQIQIAVAAAQTAYALNNGGGLNPMHPWNFLDDVTTQGRAGYTPLNVSVPPGFIVQSN